MLPDRYAGKFLAGHVSITAAAMTAAGRDAMRYLKRHLSGDWGDVTADEKAANDAAAGAGGRLRSVYHTDKGDIVVITDAERTSTRLITPQEEAFVPADPFMPVTGPAAVRVPGDVLPTPDRKSKLTEETVREILILWRDRDENSLSQRQIAEKFGLPYGTVATIIQRRTWQHVSID